MNKKMIGQFDGNLGFIDTRFHFGIKDNEDFVQVSFPTVGSMNCEVKSWIFEDKQITLVIEFNQMPCEVHLSFDNDTLTGKANLKSIQFESDIKFVKITNDPNFDETHTVIPEQNLHHLRSFQSYNNQSCHVSFTYELENKQVLQYLKEQDLSVENNHDFNTLIKLQEKLSKKIRQDGANYTHNKQQSGTIAQLDHAIKQGCVTNCRGLAIALSGIFRAYGFQASYIECRSYQQEDSELHVVCEVIVPDFNKTVVFDPSINGIYYKDNIPLSLIELKECLIQNKLDKLHLNKTSTHANKPYPLIDALAYMSKNLFVFRKALHNTEDKEISFNNSICLVPEELKKNAEKLSCHITSCISDFYK